MSYYKIWKYLVGRGLTESQAHYVRNMIRKLVEDAKTEQAMNRHYGRP